MATTTNYGWSTPDDTALVSQGAAAIRTLGSSADTTVKALSPGTTAGDVDYYTSSTAKARLGIGTTGQVLTVAGGVPSWAAVPSGGMTLISTTTLSGASVTISSIPTTYNDLYMYLTNVRPFVDGANITMAFNADNTANRHGEKDFTNGTAAFNGTNTQIMPALDDTVTTGNFWIKIPNYTNTSIWKFAEIQGLGANNTTPTNYTTWWYHALYNQTTAITSLKFATNTGNFNAGTVYLYGVK